MRMRDNEHIDKIIAGKAGNFEKEPPPEIWDHIRQNIKAERKPIIPFAWRIAAGFAVTIGLSGVLYLSYYNSNSKLKETYSSEEVDIQGEMEESSASVRNTETPSVVKQETSAQSDPVYHGKEEKVFAAQKENLITETGTFQNNSKQNYINETTATASTEKSLKPVLALFRIPFQHTPRDARSEVIKSKATKREYNWSDLAYMDNTEETEKTEETRKDISLSALMSPTYSYRDISGSAVSSNFENEHGKISYSGGMEVGYKAGKRLSVHAGLVYSKLGYSVTGVANVASPADINWLSTKSYLPKSGEDLLVSNSIGAIAGERVITNAESGKRNESYSQAQSMDFLNSGGLNKQAEQALNAGLELDQYLHFMEVPFTFRYTLVDRDVDLKLVGGLSTNFLVGNQLIINQGNGSDYIGKTDAIRTVNFAGNFGFGIDYDIRDNLILLFEPRIKYYLNSINETYLITNRPYSVGFYTGMRYFFR